MKKGRRYSREEIEVIAKSAIGMTFRELKDKELVTVSEKSLKKGGLGQLIETALYGIQTNNESEPDFMPAGVELKVTPYKKNKDGTLSAKERLVLNIIDYSTEFVNEFRSSHFWFKNSKIELMWYLSEKNKNKLDYVITHEKFIELALSEDIKQIEEDWNTIINKIRNGKAHEISEADTMYLGACTKGINKESERSQPFSKIKAKQRAFCFKQSYMTGLVRKYIGNYSDVEKVLKNNTDTFDEFIDNIVSKYKGKSQKELMKEFRIDSSAKNINNMLISRMFHVKSKLKDTDEFVKAKIIPKTIRIEQSGRIKESISFPYFKFTDIIEQDWETCDLKEELETTKYMFFVFKKENNEYIFRGIKLWNMPEMDIETSVMDMWKKTYDVIKSGNIVKYIKNGKRKTNFVGVRQNRVCHVRPHGRNAQDMCKLPVIDKLTGASEYTKHCFWINNKYVKEIFSEFLDSD